MLIIHIGPPNSARFIKKEDAGEELEKAYADYYLIFQKLDKNMNFLRTHYHELHDVIICSVLKETLEKSFVELVEFYKPEFTWYGETINKEVVYPAIIDVMVSRKSKEYREKINSYAKFLVEEVVK